MNPSTIAQASTSLALLAAPALAQAPLHVFDGPEASFTLGFSVGSADLNGDGFADIIAGAPFANPSGDDELFQLGAVRAFSGLDGSLLFSFDGDETEDFVGSSVSGAGDVDGDGFEDLLVGAPTDSIGSAKSGVVRLFSGQTGSLLFALEGEIGDRFGEVVAAAGDVNDDGVDDFIVGAPRALDLVGRAIVFSGIDGSALHTFDGAGPDDFFGRVVSGAGDVNDDGHADLLAAAFSNKLGSGYTRVFSGQSGEILYHIDGDPRAADGAGDVNADGHDDFIIGEPFFGSFGRVRVLSGLDSSTLLSFQAPIEFAHFGAFVDGVGDVDGDGTPDVVVGAPGPSFIPPSGFVQVFSGADGRMLHHFQGSDTDRFGAGIGGGDVNQDGFVDLIVGAPNADPNGFNSGTVFVFPGSEELGTPFCDSLPNSSGAVASLSARGSHAAMPLNATFEIHDLPSTTSGILFFGFNQLAGRPFGDGLLCVSGSIRRVLPPVTGMGQAQLTLNPEAGYADVIVPGVNLNFQFWFRDPMAMMSGFNTSDSIEILFQ